jgi:phenylalanyl-tRNA synthetase beta chain
MNIVWNWLNEYVDLPWDIEEAVKRFTMAGLKVENLSKETLDLEGVVSATVLDAKPHPTRADLTVGTVYDGKECLSVVSGAPGFRSGATVLLAVPGARLPGQEPLGAVEVGGVLSQGMVVCSNEILTGEPHRPGEDIIVLPDGTPLGKRAQDLLGLDDYVIELELTVNYSHCLSVLGVAIEASALSGSTLKLPRSLERWGWASTEGSRPPHGMPPYMGPLRIDLPDRDLCPRYVGKVMEGVRFAYSPPVTERRLQLAGMRPISAIVDATNYVMLETGQPLHAFDLDKLQGNTISARRSVAGESIVTLDGENRSLVPGTLIIADAGGPVGVAGVMGNKDTEVSESTERILIESAYFAPIPVRKTYREMKLRTEAAIRFEKGIDPTAQGAVAERAAELIGQLTGGVPQDGLVETDFSGHSVKRLSFKLDEVRRTLGVDVPYAECKKFLAGLGFGVEAVKGSEESQDMLVTVPPRRVDIEEEIDLTEEIARSYGVNYFEPADLTIAVPGGPWDENSVRTEKLRDVLVSLGGLEAISNSLNAPSDLSVLGWYEDDLRGNPVMLMNPLSSNESCLRTSLLPGLLKAVANNQKVKNPGGLFWEIGRVFFRSQEGLPTEMTQLALISYGELEPKTWAQAGREAGFFHMKGVVESALTLMGVPEAVFMPDAGMPFHPGKSARILVEGSAVGSIGEIHPMTRAKLDLSVPVFMAWLSLDALSAFYRPNRYRQVSKFMPVERDVAVVVAEDVSAGDVLTLVQNVARDLVSVSLFDVWRKPPVPEGSKSLALRLVYQAWDRTLTEEELAHDRKRILDALGAKYGARQRL